VPEFVLLQFLSRAIAGTRRGTEVLLAYRADVPMKRMQSHFRFSVLKHVIKGIS
jgi:hypothetical protein